MADPVVIYLEKERSYIDVFERAGQIFLRGLTAENDGFVRQLEPTEAHALIEALEGFECMQDKPLLGFLDHPGYEHRCTYRYWHYWVQSTPEGTSHQAWVYNPDVNEKPGPLGPPYTSHEQAVAAAIAWIDKQYVPEEDVGVIG